MWVEQNSAACSSTLKRCVGGQCWTGRSVKQLKGCKPDAKWHFFLVVSCRKATVCRRQDTGHCRCIENLTSTSEAKKPTLPKASAYETSTRPHEYLWRVSSFSETVLIYICMGPLMVTFSKTQNNVTTAAFAAWSLQCHYGVTTMSLQRHSLLKSFTSSCSSSLFFARFLSQNGFFTIEAIQ